MGGGTHTGFVGEQAAGYAVTHGFPYRNTGYTAQYWFRSKGFHKDGLNGVQKSFTIDDQNDKAADNIENCHQGNHLFRDGSNTAHAAEEDESCDNGDDNTHGNGGNIESSFKSRADGVGLYHISGKAQSENNGDGEESSQNLAEFSLKTGLDVVDGAASHLAGAVGGFKLLCQHGFAVNGSHAEKGREPHPENCAGAAGIESRGTASDVASANLRCNGGGQSLEGGHAVFAGFFAPQRKTAEKPTEAFAKLSYLHKPGSDGEPNTGTYQ